MGYQVGSVCYDSIEQAQNVYFSQVVPLATPNGLIYPVHTVNGWTFNNESLVVSFVECSIVNNFTDGMTVGWAFFAVLAAAYGIRIIMGLMS